LLDETTRAKQESVQEVAEAGGGAGQEWTERSGFLPGAGSVCPQFFAWKKKLRQGEPASFVEVKVAGPEVEGVGSSDRSIEVRLRNGRGLVVGPGFDEHHVRALLPVVETEA
jgi:hypothetical protein